MTHLESWKLEQLVLLKIVGEMFGYIDRRLIVLELEGRHFADMEAGAGGEVGMNEFGSWECKTHAVAEG